MAGQIISRGKKIWLVRVFTGRDPQTGKREYYNKTVHGAKKSAEDELTRALNDRNRGLLCAGAMKTTLDTLFDDLLHDYKINGKSYEWAKQIVDRQLQPFFGQIPIARLTTDHIRNYVAKRNSEGKANATINNELALLRRSLKLGMNTTPPKVLRVPRIEKLKTNNVRKGFFEHAEYIALREALPTYLRPVLTFAYHTGCRRGEILSLVWSQVDLDERIVRLEPGTTKNDESRMIPLAGELFETVQMQREVRDARFPNCDRVFFRDGEPILDFKNAWARGCQRAGLWTGDEMTGKATRLFHDLRRTGVRNLVRAGVPEKVAQKISGHKTRAVFDRYNIVNETDLKDAMRRLADYHSQHAEPGTPSTHKTDDWHTIGTQNETGKIQ